MRIAVLFDNFGPYHVARLAAAAEYGQVLAVEANLQSEEYAWERSAIPETLEHVNLARSSGGKNLTWNSTGRVLDGCVAVWKPDVVAVPGWSTPSAIRTALWAHERGIPIVVMSDSNSWDHQRRRSTEFVKRRLVQMFSSGLCAGEPQKSYLAGLGMPNEAISLGFDVVDNHYFETQALRARNARVMPEIGPSRCLDAEWFGKYFLAVARFVPMKNLATLLDAYAVYRSEAPGLVEAWPLVILGDGALRPDLERKRGKLGLDNVVHMPGFKQYGELPLFYGSAGALVHVSCMEPWGLVVNEAMASGLPVVISNRCGCADTLVEDDGNGVIVEPGDIAAIALALRHIASCPSRAAMGEASRRRIAEWGPHRFAQGLHDAAHYAYERGPTRPPFGIAALGRVVSEINAERLRGDAR